MSSTSGDGIKQGPSPRELRPAHAGTVRGDDPQSPLLRLHVDIGRLVMGADQAVEEEGRMTAGVPIFPDLQPPPAPHDEGVLHRPGLRLEFRTFSGPGTP